MTSDPDNTQDDEEQTDNQHSTEGNLNYPEVVPKEIQLAVEALGEGNTKQRFGIVMALLDSTDAVHITDLAEMLDREPDDIEPQLNELQKGGIVAKKVGEKIGDKSTGGYTVTKYGWSIINGLYEASKPKYEQDTDTQSDQDSDGETQ